jgi:hypothetical protein
MRSSCNADPGLWRITLDYLSHCGKQGFGHMREIVLTVPIVVDLGATGPKPNKGKGKEATIAKADEKAGDLALPEAEPAKFDDVCEPVESTACTTRHAQSAG